MARKVRAGRHGAVLIENREKAAFPEDFPLAGSARRNMRGRGFDTGRILAVDARSRIPGHAAEGMRGTCPEAMENGL